MIIDKEFQKIIPQLTTEEFTQLKENILKEGCRDALIVWNDVLIDGHNRYLICTENDIPFTTKEIEFESREEAKEWIIKNQFGRRNLLPYQRSELALRIKQIVQIRAKENIGGFKGNQYASGSSQKSDTNQKIRTDDELAKLAGVSRDTIHKTELIINEGTDEQKKRARLGGKGNSINAISEEIKKAKKEADTEAPSRDNSLDTIEEPIKEYPRKKASKDPYDHPLYDLSTVPEYSIDILIGEMEATEETVLYWVNAWCKDGEKFLHIKENAERFNKALDNLINIFKERKIYETTN